MSRTFAYVRVSTIEQTTENQIREIESSGFKVDPRRIVSETVSRSSAIEQRPRFQRFLDRLEYGDILIVTKLDWLGRNAIDGQQTAAKLQKVGVHVHCLALGNMDLTSASGKMTMGVISAVAQFERDLLIERTQAGLTRARKEGRKPGRPASLPPEQQAAVRAGLATGTSVIALSKRCGTSRQSILRAKAAPTIGAAR